MDKSVREDHQASSAVQSNSILLGMMQLSEAIDNMASDQKMPDTMQVQHIAKDGASFTLSRDNDLRNACKLNGSKVPNIMMACSDCIIRQKTIAPGRRQWLALLAIG